MTACRQITCAIPWLSCEQLPYPPEHPRISRMQRRDKSDLVLPSLSYKYFLLRFSSSILSFYSLIPTFLAAALLKNFKNSGQRSPPTISQVFEFFLSLGSNGHQLRRPWGQPNTPFLLYTLVVLLFISESIYWVHFFSFLFPFLFFQPSNFLGVGR